MKKIILFIILMAAIILLLGQKKSDKPKISEKDLLKIHISANPSK